MLSLLTRVRDRSVLLLTALLFLIRGTTLLIMPAGNAVLAKGGAFVVVPGTVWGWGFVVIGILCLAAALFFGYYWGRQALVWAAAWSFGFSTVYLTLVILGDLSILSGVIVWLYIGFMMLVSSKAIDPHLLKTIERQRNAAVRRQ